jgi:hypothetical protein
MEDNNKINPHVRGQVAEIIRTSCVYGSLVVPFGKDLEDMIDWLIDNTPTSREFGDKLQDYHNNNRKNIALFSEMNSNKEKRSAMLNQRVKEVAWDEAVKEKKKAEEALKEPVETPNASPFGDSFK